MIAAFCAQSGRWEAMTLPSVIDNGHLGDLIVPIRNSCDGSGASVRLLTSLSVTIGYLI